MTATPNLNKWLFLCSALLILVLVYYWANLRHATDYLQSRKIKSATLATITTTGHRSSLEITDKPALTLIEQELRKLPCGIAGPINSLDGPFVYKFEFKLDDATSKQVTFTEKEWDDRCDAPIGVIALLKSKRVQFR